MKPWEVSVRAIDAIWESAFPRALAAQWADPAFDSDTLRAQWSAGDGEGFRKHIRGQITDSPATKSFRLIPEFLMQEIDGPQAPDGTFPGSFPIRFDPELEFEYLLANDGLTLPWPPRPDNRYDIISGYLDQGDFPAPWDRYFRSPGIDIAPSVEDKAAAKLKEMRGAVSKAAPREKAWVVTGPVLATIRSALPRVIARAWIRGAAEYERLRNERNDDRRRRRLIAMLRPAVHAGFNLNFIHEVRAGNLPLRLSNHSITQDGLSVVLPPFPSTELVDSFQAWYEGETPIPTFSNGSSQCS